MDEECNSRSGLIQGDGYGWTHYITSPTNMCKLDQMFHTANNSSHRETLPHNLQFRMSRFQLLLLFISVGLFGNRGRCSLKY